MKATLHLQGYKRLQEGSKEEGLVCDTLRRVAVVSQT